jgi:hypothetical protein
MAEVTWSPYGGLPTNPNTGNNSASSWGTPSTPTVYTPPSTPTPQV